MKESQRLERRERSPARENIAYHIISSPSKNFISDWVVTLNNSFTKQLIQLNNFVCESIRPQGLMDVAFGLMDFSHAQITGTLDMYAQDLHCFTSFCLCSFLSWRLVASSCCTTLVLIKSL